MTMPSKMTCRHSKEGSAEYIRADLAEELARALEAAEGYLQRGHDKMAHNIIRHALANYKEATK